MNHATRATLNQGSPYPTQMPIQKGRGKTWYVDTNRESVSNGDALGASWESAFTTLDEAFDVVGAGDTIYIAGNINECLTSPTGAANVSLIGVAENPKHADTHPLNGELAATTWKIGALGNLPLLILNCPGWTIENILFAAHASNYAIRLDRNAIEDDTEEDASHLIVRNCRFASGAGGINDTGGCFNVRIEDNVFAALTSACILGVGNIGVGQLQWTIRGNHFNNFTNGVKIAAHECRVYGNFFTDGGTPNTTFVLNMSNGAGRDNFIVDNFFQTATANFNTPDVVGNATDVWARNVSIDSTAAGVGTNTEWGQPA